MENSANETLTNKTSASTWRWITGMVYIVAVALIWIAASFVVQSVVGSGVSPFLITYICNSLFIVYIPIIEGRRALEKAFQQHGWGTNLYRKLYSEAEVIELPPQMAGGFLESKTLLEAPSRSSDVQSPAKKEISVGDQEVHDEKGLGMKEGQSVDVFQVSGSEKEGIELAENCDNETNQPWPRKRTALIGMTICPFWFLAQFTFNLSLKYTTVTSNTILSTTSSLFTFLVSLQFLGENFTWLKLASVSLCMAGTIIVSLGDSWEGEDKSASRPLLGDVLCLASAMFYATYTALIRVKIPDEDDERGKVSTALVFGYLGLFNALFLAPVALLLHITGVEPFHRLSLKQVGLIVGKGLFDNVLSDYLWARAVLLTTPTAATAGLTIQVPIAAVIDSLSGSIPSYMNIIGAITVLIGFFGINTTAPIPPSPIEEQVDKEDSLT